MEQKDHDLLIRLDTKISMICKQLTNFQILYQKQHNELKQLMNKSIDDVHARVDINENRIDKKLDKDYFRWVFRSIIGILIVATIFTTSNVITSNDRFKDIETKICILHNGQDEVKYPIINQP